MAFMHPAIKSDKTNIKGTKLYARTFVPFVTLGTDKTPAFSASKEWRKYGVSLLLK
jgi:hypothetical protein